MQNNYPNTEREINKLSKPVLAKLVLDLLVEVDKYQLKVNKLQASKDAYNIVLAALLDEQALIINQLETKLANEN